MLVIYSILCFCTSLVDVKWICWLFDQAHTYFSWTVLRAPLIAITLVFINCSCSSPHSGHVHKLRHLSAVWMHHVSGQVCRCVCVWCVCLRGCTSSSLSSLQFLPSLRSPAQFTQIGAAHTPSACSSHWASSCEWRCVGQCGLRGQWFLCACAAVVQQLWVLVWCVRLYL